VEHPNPQPPRSSRRCLTTGELAHLLACDLTPTPSIMPLSCFLILWCAASIAFYLPALLLAPTRHDLIERLGQTAFWVETSLWILAATGSAVLFYRSSIPGMMMRRRDRWLGLLPLFIVCGLWASQLHATGWVSELVSEMDAWRGRCGFVILGVGAASAFLMFRWARNAAPTRPRSTGVWAALSAGSLASFAMQIVCAHANALHLWVWHVVPIVLLAIAGAWLGARMLRWGARS
jgi:hypothetical protein